MTEQDTALPTTGPNSPDSNAPEIDSSSQSSRRSVEDRAADCINGLSSRLGTLDLARGLIDGEASPNAQRRILGHYVAAAHGMMMELCAEARGFLGQAQPDSLDDQAHKRALTAARLAGTGARFMERIRLGIQSLNGLAQGGDGPNGGGPNGGERNFIYHMIEGTDDRVRQYEFDLAKVLAAGGSGKDMPVTETTWPFIVRPDANRSAAPARRGRLKNGNPPGDFLAAPRCGARTRAGGCCRQPAMANGRCRLHGGFSTGPRTPQGLARSRAARLSHGCSSAKIIDLRRAAAALGRRFDRALAAVQATIPAGHGVDRAFFVRATGRSGELQQKQGRQPQEREESQHIRGGRQERPRADRRIHA